jgi:8-oxo-dGTP diphosphatase
MLRPDRRASSPEPIISTKISGTNNVMMPTTNSSSVSPLIQAAGGVLCRKTTSGNEVMIVHRKRYGDWVLPKGKLRPSESFPEAARREVQEETGCSIHLLEYLRAIGYPVKDVPKVVLFWKMSLAGQHDIADKAEVEEVAWMEIAEALQRLTHSEERAFLSRVLCSARPYQPRELSRPQRVRRSWPWFQGRGRSYARLLREFEVFRVELAFLEHRGCPKETDWVAATYDQLGNVERYLEDEDIEGGWLSLHAARRNMVFGLSKTELAIQAAILREETAKVSSWRGKVMKNILSVTDDRLAADRVKEAMALRDEYAANQYHKIWLMGDQLGVLLKIRGLAVPLLVPLIVFFSRHSEGSLPPWGYQTVMSVLFFGLLGATFSVAQSLINDTNEARIVERVANHFVTIARAFFGGVAGLAGYAFLESKVIHISLGTDDSTGGALAFAFLFGYTGERLVARVAGSVSAPKS